MQMQNLKRILECREGKRCNSPLSCRKCGESWQKGKFKAFANCLPSVVEASDILTYIIVKSNELNTLSQGISDLMGFMDSLREAKKRGKLTTSFSRLEVSFGKKSLGFNPHLNMLVWGDFLEIERLSKLHSLKLWKQSKKNSITVAKSIAWYMLKHNKIGIEKGEAVRIALNKRTPLLYTKEFNHKTISYIDEFIDIDFSFMGVYPVRSKKEIKLRDSIREAKAKLNQSLKNLIASET